MKKIFFVVFSLIMMCSVSFCIEANKEYVINEDTGTSSGSNKIGNYTPKMIYTILKNFSSDKTNEDYKNELNLLISEVKSLGHKYVVFYNSEKNMYYLLINNINHDIDFFIKDGLIGLLYEDGCQGGLDYGYLYGYSSSYCTYYNDSSVGIPLYHGYCYAVNIIPSVTSIYDSNTDIYNLSLGMQEHYWSQAVYYYWDGVSYAYKVGGSSSEVPEITDEELSNIVNMFVNSDALSANRLSGWNDFYITYNSLTDSYYAYVYDSGYRLMMRYGDFDEEDNFIYSGTEEGSYFETTLDIESLGLGEILDYFTKFKIGKRVYQEYSIYPELNRVSYHQDLANEQTYHNVENEFIVYTTKPIKLYTKDNTGSLVATENYIDKTILTDSETGEEIEIIIPDETASNTVFSKIVSVINTLGDRIASIFEPDVTSVAYLKSTIENKLPVIGELKTIIDNLLAIFSNENPEPPTITIPLSQAESSIDYGADCIALDLSWYERYKDTVDLVIIGFAYAIFAWRLYQRIPGIISGTDGINWGVFGTGKSEYSGSGNFGFKSGGGNK